jgi:repressor LexA
MKNIALTRAEERTFAFIKQYIKEKKYSPTVQEIADGTGLSSRGVIYRYVHALKEKGVIQLLPGRHRNILLNESFEAAIPNVVEIQGLIAAGQPIEAIVNCETVDYSHFSSEETFSLKVKGDSMIDEGILDQDIVICRTVSQVNDGDVVVALIDNESATLKRIYRKGDNVELRPANASHQSIFFRAERVFIQGKLLGVVRFYT